MTDHDHGEPLTIDDVMIGLGRQQVRAIRAEAALEQAEARVDQLTDAAEHWRTRSHALTNELALTRDTLTKRSDALNRAGATNDTLRATLARIEALASKWERWGPSSPSLTVAAVDIRAALAEQEPNA